MAKLYCKQRLQNLLLFYRGVFVLLALECLEGCLWLLFSHRYDSGLKALYGRSASLCFQSYGLCQITN